MGENEAWWIMRFELMAGGAMPSSPDDMYEADQLLYFALAPIRRAKDVRMMWG